MDLTSFLFKRATEIIINSPLEKYSGAIYPFSIYSDFDFAHQL